MPNCWAHPFVCGIVRGTRAAPVIAPEGPLAQGHLLAEIASGVAAVVVPTEARLLVGLIIAHGRLKATLVVFGRHGARAVERAQVRRGSAEAMAIAARRGADVRGGPPITASRRKAIAIGRGSAVFVAGTHGAARALAATAVSADIAAPSALADVHAEALALSTVVLLGRFVKALSGVAWRAREGISYFSTTTRLPTAHVTARARVASY